MSMGELRKAVVAAKADQRLMAKAVKEAGADKAKVKEAKLSLKAADKAVKDAVKAVNKQVAANAKAKKLN